MAKSKGLRDPDGGLTEKGRRHYEDSGESKNLRPGVKSYDKASETDKKRWVNWANRFADRDDIPPLKKDNGDPTRFALMFQAWGEPIPNTEADVRKVARKANKRGEQLKKTKK